MPTFDRLEFLRPAIQSVFAQTLSDWELIIADDGSAAATRAYLKSLDDPRVKILWLPHSGRPSAVSNIAIREARGDYIAFLDSDDLWLPAKLAMQVESLRNHPERGWSYTRFALVDSSGNSLVSKRVTDWPAPSGWILEKILTEATVIAQPSVIVSRPLLQRLGAFDEELVMCYDDELWLRLAAHSEIDGIDAPLTLVRRHLQHSGSDIIAWRDRRRVFEKALRTAAYAPLHSTLRSLRAQMSAGLAKSQIASGDRAGAVGTLFKSFSHSWRYPKYWLGPLVRMATSYAPRAMRGAVRRYRLKHGARIHGA
jgi:glycosyltransferase involved in cell wall biosynthesis